MNRAFRQYPRVPLISKDWQSVSARLLLFTFVVLHCAAQSNAGAPAETFCRHIAVDQFGYLPEMRKVAVVSDPQLGFNAAQSYTPGKVLEIRSWKSNEVVFAGSPVPWSNGITHLQSGDRVWWFDFSAVTRPGEYVVYDPSQAVHSARFRIAGNVYEDVLKHAVRVFYYQRRGTAKIRPYADSRWTDDTNFLGPMQDHECRLMTNPTLASQKDLRGGWFDAGDYNKYVNFTLVPVSDLLFAYAQNPRIWGDNWDIPESGNGIPDLLDEVKWELDWLLRMQNANGSVLSKMGSKGFQSASPPSTERSQVFYGPESTTATLTAAGNFAQAAPIYRSVGMDSYALSLSNAAGAAYNWAVANPSVIYSNTGFASANPEVDITNYPKERDRLRIRAAIFLCELTGRKEYQAYVESNYRKLEAIGVPSWNAYNAPVQDALLHFTTLPGISGQVVSEIRNSKQAAIDGVEFMGAWNNGQDAYGSYVVDGGYHWGNNCVKSHTGLLFAQQVTYRLNPARAGDYRDAAAGYLHYLHGVNPLVTVYLSNMYAYGADLCVNSIYHGWFEHGTPYDDALSSPKGPAPGYVTGGANKNFRPDPAYAGPRLTPPMDQPPQKAYRDWNSGWPENSWEITEPSITYQAAYVFQLSRFVQPTKNQRETH